MSETCWWQRWQRWMNQTLVSINKLSKKGLGNNTMDLQQLTTVPLRMPPPLITEILPDIVNSCRLCLDGDGSNMRNIFCNDHRNWADDDISDQIYESTSLQVYPSLIFESVANTNWLYYVLGNDSWWTDGNMPLLFARSSGSIVFPTALLTCQRLSSKSISGYLLQ